MSLDRRTATLPRRFFTIAWRFPRRALAGFAVWSAAAAFAVVALMAGCGSSTIAKNSDAATAPYVAVAKVSRRNLTNQLDIASEFQPYQEINVYAKVSGYIKKLDVDWGTHVRQGEVLAQLEIPELQQQLQLDQAAVGRSEQDVARAREELKRAQSAYTVAHLTYTRLASVQKQRPELVAQEEVDVAQGKDMEADAGVSSAKDALAGAQEGFAAARATLEKDTDLYSYSRITAPFSGVVTEIDAYTGTLLPAGTSSNKGDQPLCHLAQNSLLRVVIPVPESAVPDIHLHEPVQVRVAVLNKAFQGTIARVADEVDLATRTMHTEIEVPNPTLEIVPGMYADALIQLKQGRNALAVPVQALDRAGGQVTVFVVGRDSTIHQTAVKLGIQTPDYAEVISGLNEGDLVAIGNPSQFRSGMLVRPREVAAASADGGM